jgi:DNA modification methylase
LDPFNGSGTTGIGCKLEGIDYVGIDRDQEYCNISKGRIENWTEELETMIIREEKEANKNPTQLGLDL